MKPVFVFSLPRSGSTLLQRMLMAHSKISSVAEPWLLLPLVYMYREHGMLAEYGHSVCRVALSDLVSNTKGGMETHRHAMRGYADLIYSSAGEPSSEYFVDKTPRYYKIIGDVFSIFPDSKIIFLFRSPLQVLASLIDDRTGRTLENLSVNHMDLHEGPPSLAEGYRDLRGRCLALNYETLVTEPEPAIRRICDFLELTYENVMVEKFQNQDGGGRMGDHAGSDLYTRVVVDSLDKWQLVLADPLRRFLAKRYILSLDGKVLDSLGYDKAELVADLDRLAMQRRVSARDLYHYFRGLLARLAHANLLFGSRNAWARNRYIS